MDEHSERGKAQGQAERRDRACPDFRADSTTPRFWKGELQRRCREYCRGAAGNTAEVLQRLFKQRLRACPNTPTSFLESVASPGLKVLQTRAGNGAQTTEVQPGNMGGLGGSLPEGEPAQPGPGDVERPQRELFRCQPENTTPERAVQKPYAVP